MHALLAFPPVLDRPRRTDTSASVGPPRPRVCARPSVSRTLIPLELIRFSLRRADETRTTLHFGMQQHNTHFCTRILLWGEEWRGSAVSGGYRSHHARARSLAHLHAQRASAASVRFVSSPWASSTRCVSFVFPMPRCSHRVVDRCLEGVP